MSGQANFNVTSNGDTVVTITPFQLKQTNLLYVQYLRERELGDSLSFVLKKMYVRDSLYQQLITTSNKQVELLQTQNELLDQKATTLNTLYQDAQKSSRFWKTVSAITTSTLILFLLFK